MSKEHLLALADDYGRVKILKRIDHTRVEIEVDDE